MADDSQIADPVFSIQRMYLKEASLEQPNSPAILLEQETPNVEIQLSLGAEEIAEGVYEVTVMATVQTKLSDDRTVFLVEAKQAGVFQIRNVPEENLEPLLAIACPNVLFPYAREVVSSAIARAGFAPVVLQPVNFEALYMARQAEAQQAGANEVPIQ